MSRQTTWAAAVCVRALHVVEAYKKHSVVVLVLRRRWRQDAKLAVVSVEIRVVRLPNPMPSVNAASYTS